MKKHIFIYLLAALFLAGCVKDEQPAPAPPPAINYDDIVINELITKDTANPYFISGNGHGADWIELYNKGAKSINIADMWITDKPGEEAEYNQIPNTEINITTIPPKGFVVLICGASDAGGADIPTSIIDGKIFIDMGLSSSSDNTVALYNPEKVLIDESDDFNGLADDKSFGRVTDAGAEWNTLAEKTPGASNDGSTPVAGGLIINEFMCSNDTTFIPDGGPDDFPDWIEIYNTGETPIDIGGWYVTESLADTTLYQIPTDIPGQTLIPGHGYLILKANGLGEGLHLSFKLGSGGDDIGLSQDGTTYVDALSYGNGAGGGTPVETPATDMSVGRDTDGSAAWVVFDPNTGPGPTPGTANGN
jgi:hypothetical protein